ncbi:hypothetical protein LTR85_004135 [Meristemomyces frigidus]|nr:hypothetical protein LTR85_004135 [Meristemomyces frigidus]
MASRPAQAAPASPPVRSQYHHFIPRFILRGFADSIQPPAGPATVRAGGKAKPKRKDAKLNMINLRDGSLFQRPLSREYGLVDMYRDAQYPRQHDIEERLAQLETAVGRILQKAKTTFSKPGSVLTLARAERDTLRRFLFLMKYRNMGFYGRYNHESIDEYSADDKEKMRAYMLEKGFKSPRDVWFANLRAFLDLTMDVEGRWRTELQARAYPDDVELLKLHIDHKYLAFCRPRSTSDEFLMTQNVYSIFEGPMSEIVDVATGKTKRGLWDEWHSFAPITPGLIVVLRSNLLPDGLHGDNNSVRKAAYDALRSVHSDPEKARSILEDLPAERCRNSYSKVQSGRLTLNSDSTGLSAKDESYFKSFPLSSRHVNTINSFLLEEGVSTTALTYRTRTAAAKAVKHYLEDTDNDLKIIYGPQDPRLKYLATLEQALQNLGATAATVSHGRSLPGVEPYLRAYRCSGARIVGTKVCKAISEGCPELMDIYRTLTTDHTAQAFAWEVEQACKLLYIFVETELILSRAKASKERKDRFRTWRDDSIMSSSTQRVWLFLKVLRNLCDLVSGDLTKQVEALELKGPEDSVAEGK